MNKQFLKDAFFWGFVLWLLGYVLGIVLFAIVPKDLIGWIIMPIGIPITLWVLIKKVNRETAFYYILIGIIWLLIAVIFDYFFLVQLFHPADGYYKLDVYIYYAWTLILPITVGVIKKRKNKTT